MIAYISPCSTLVNLNNDTSTENNVDAITIQFKILNTTQLLKTVNK